MSAPGGSTSDSPQRLTRRVNIGNSLSTLNPTHHAVMNMNSAKVPAQPGMLGGRALTVRDIILWQQEQARSLGELGFTTNFPDPADIFKPFAIDPHSENGPPADDDAAPIAPMEEFHRAIMQVQQRKILMDRAGPLMAKTNKIVNQKLLNASVPDNEFAHKSLRQKIVQLVELKDPPPKKNFVEVSVYVASIANGRSHMLEVNLPLKADVVKIYALLDEVVKALLAEKGLSYEGGEKWKYQLVDHTHSRLLRGKSLPLETDLEYNLMVQQVSRVGDQQAPKAILTQNDLARPIVMSGANAEALGGPGVDGNTMSNALEVPGDDDDEVPDEDEVLEEDEMLDEDGKPYFEPIDMPRMLKKYAKVGDDLVGENGIRGFWR